MTPHSTSAVNISLFPLIILSGLGSIALSIITNNYLMLTSIVILPLVIIFLIEIIRYPVILFFSLIVLHYFYTIIYRVAEIDGLSVMVDYVALSIMVLILMHTTLYRNIEWKRVNHVLSVGTFIWMLYCVAEIANPSGVLKAWIYSRGFIISGFIFTLFASLLITNRKLFQTFFFIYSILSLIAVAQAFIQKYIGFNAMELRWLNDGNYHTHLLSTGTRYFSVFSDAGNFGSNMGCAGLVFTIGAFYTKNNIMKLYYFAVGLLTTYALFLSGTRGAIIVPLGGLLLYTLINKNIKIMIISGFTLIFIYLFFAFTTIGQGNELIRRMRTAFRPTEDASFNIRRDNQKKLAVYMENKPFGEGLGLSGVENQVNSVRFTTLIPHDSWYVKIWVETGIVGIIIYISILLVAVGRGCWILMFKIRDPEVKGKLTGLLCGIFGMILSAYGNAFFGQFPTTLIAFTGLTIVLNGEYFDISTEKTKQLTTNN